MRLDSRFVNWGIFFILLGALPLLVQENLLDRDAVARGWQLWPLLIVGAGVGLLLRQTPLAFTGGLIGAVTFGIILGSMLAVGGGIGQIGSACGGGRREPFATQQGTFSGSASVRLEFSCGDMNVTTAAGSGWSVSGLTHDGTSPRADQSGDALVVRASDRTFGFFDLGNAANTWDVILPRDVPIDLRTTVNAGSSVIVLGGAQLDRYRIDLNAGSVKLDLTDARVGVLTGSVNAGSVKIQLPVGNVTGSLDVNAGSIALCAPADVGLQLRTNDTIIASNNFAEAGLLRAGSTWQSPDWATAQNRIDLATNANAGSFTLNPKDGCR